MIKIREMDEIGIPTYSYFDENCGLVSNGPIDKVGIKALLNMFSQ